VTIKEVETVKKFCKFDIEICGGYGRDDSFFFYSIFFYFIGYRLFLSERWFSIFRRRERDE
jgi:hypothetical protein